MELLAENNLCGHTLLSLSASGSSIIAELLRLSKNIPEVFLSEEKDQNYKPVLFDFGYLKRPDDFEKKINASTNLVDVDGEFFEAYEAILMRFYGLFESIVKYKKDFQEFVENLDSGIFIQYTVESVVQDIDGKQLMCEALYLYGTMLLLLDRHIPGPIREKMVIAVLRHKGETTLEHLESVCNLIRSTGYDPTQPNKHPKNYPENFFSRFPVTSSVVKLVIQTLQSDDIYRQARAFPSPEHRSNRLATQAGMLYVILYFAPEMLYKNDTAMRETVDRHFSDNWIITIYMGHVIDLSKEWLRYKSAAKALANILTTENVTAVSKQNMTWFREAKNELGEFLTEGVLNQQFLMVNMESLLQCMRKSNVALRWRLLHRRVDHPRFTTLIQNQIPPEEVMDLMLTSAQLEYEVKNLFSDLLDSKPDLYEEVKNACALRLTKLSEYFTGEMPLTSVKKDSRMMQWFAQLATQIQTLDEEEDHSTVMGRKLAKTIAALKEVELFDQIDKDDQILAFLSDTRDMITQLIRVVNLKHADLSKMEVITDLSYALELISDYTNVLHVKVQSTAGDQGLPKMQSEANYSVLLRAGFVKLASILDVPLTRITQVDSPDAVSVAEFYSSVLVDLMRKVLDVIPRSVFAILSQIVQVQTHSLAPLPVKFESHRLKDYAQLQHRYTLAKLTNKASSFTECVLAMEKTPLGIIQVDARQILQDGLRKELVRQVCQAMHKTIHLRASTTLVDISTDFDKIMDKLKHQMEGFRRSIEYIQDYVDLAGLKMWQEEVARVVNYNIEQECNRYLKRKVLDHNSKYQSKVIPIPRFSLKLDTKDINGLGAVNFMGRVMNALLAMTSPDTTIFAPEAIGWYDFEGQELCGIKTFARLATGVTATGLAGLDRLLSFRIVHHLTSFLRFHKDTVTQFLPLLEQIRDGLFPDSGVPNNASKLYGASLKKMEKLMTPMLKYVLRIGQAQLLRRQMGFVLKFSCRLDANLLYQALTTTNTAVLNDVKEYYRNPETKPYPKESNPLLGQLNKLLEASGMSDPMVKIYTVSEPIEGIPVLVLLFIITHMSKLVFDKAYCTLVPRRSTYLLDGMPLVVGVWTLLKQFHPSYTRQVLAYLGQFVRSTLDDTISASDGKTSNIPVEVTNTLLFIDMFCKVGKIPRSAISEFIPSYILDAVQTGNG